MGATLHQSSRAVAALLAGVLAGCGAVKDFRSKKSPDSGPAAPAVPTPAPGTAVASPAMLLVDQGNLDKVMKEMSGYLPVTVGGQQVSLTDRYLPASKANWRAFWTAYFEGLGIPVTALPYTTAHAIGETQGHNLEAVLPGKSADSIVIIVHYDSIGPNGQEAANQGIDDDMSGMAIMLETARIFAAHKGGLANTVRFVAADYEEQVGPKLEGARQYVTYLKAKSAAEGFKILSGIDDEQTGWNCAATTECGDDTQGDVFDIWSCSDDANAYNFNPLGDRYAALVAKYSNLKAKRGCMNDDSDHYALWEAGIPAVMFTEHNPLLNNHFDHNGGDVLAKIDLAYHFRIAQVAIELAAELAGLQLP